MRKFQTDAEWKAVHSLNTWCWRSDLQVLSFFSFSSLSIMRLSPTVSGENEQSTPIRDAALLPTGPQRRLLFVWTP